MPREALAELVKVERESLAACKIPPPLPEPEAPELRRAGPPEVGSSGLDLRPLIDAFLDYQAGVGRSVHTIKRQRNQLRYWTRYLTGQGVTDLAEVTPHLAAGYQGWLYNYRTRFGGPFAVDAQITILNTLQVFYRYLVRTGKVLADPTEVIRLPKHPRRLPAVTLSAREMKRLLAQPDTTTILGFLERTLYEVLYSTGLRVGELIGLRLRDLPPALRALAGPGLRPDRDWPSVPDGCLFVRGGKNKRDRLVPLGEPAARHVAEYLRRIRPMCARPACAGAEPAAAEQAEQMFLNMEGRPLDPTTINGKLQAHARRAGIAKRITVHTLRHTLATEMLKGGADLRQIQELLGHTTLRTTTIYTHIVKGELRRVQAQCHPREQTELPEGFIRYQGRDYLTDQERRETATAHREERPEHDA